MTESQTCISPMVELVGVTREMHEVQQRMKELGDKRQSLVIELRQTMDVRQIAKELGITHVRVYQIIAGRH
jgi:hypothetical protein